MRRKHLFVLTMIAALSLAANPVCAADTLSRAESAAEAVPAAGTQSPAESPAEALPAPAVTVGQKTENPRCYSVVFQNKTGKTITGIKVKDIYAGAYSDNMMKEAQEIGPDTVFELNFDASSFGEKDQFNILFEYGEKETGSITMFPFGEALTCELKITDKLTHITYTDQSGAEKDTLETEKKYRHISSKKTASGTEDAGGSSGGEESGDNYDEYYDYSSDYDDSSDYDYDSGNSADNSGSHAVKEEPVAAAETADDAKEEEPAENTGGEENTEDTGDTGDEDYMEDFDLGDVDEGFEVFYDDFDDGSGSGSDGCIGSGGCIGGGSEGGSEGCIGGGAEEESGEDLW